MNKYLEKIAKEYYEQVNDYAPTAGHMLGSAVIGGVAAHQVNSRLGNLIQDRVVYPMLTSAPTVPADIMEKIKLDTLAKTNTTMHLPEAGGHQITHEVIRGISGSPAFISKEGMNSLQSRLHRLNTLSNKFRGIATKLGLPYPSQYNGELANAPKFTKNYLTMGGAPNTDILAHELGHAVDFSTGRVGLKKAVSATGRFLHGVPSAALGGLALADDRTRDYAWMVPLATALPTMREEAAANVHARRLVKKFGGNTGGLKGMIARNTLSYAIPALAASGSLAGMAHLQRKGEEINADEYLGQDRSFRK